MEQSDILFYKSLLLKERKNFVRTLARIKHHEIGSFDNFSSTELSSYDNHPADLGTEVFNIGMNKNLKTNELYQLDEINKAIKKIEKGTYGTCEFCGKEIAKERLEVRPQARLCIECEKSRDVDLKYLKKERPIEEDVMGTPFTRKQDVNIKENMDDRIDYLSTLMKYGSASSPQDMGGYKDYKGFYNGKVDNQNIKDEVENISNRQYKDQL